jgi:RimJ/RimL family protein N-acetyltransferase
MERCGFVLEGTQRQYWQFGGGYHDRLVFGLLANDLTPERCSVLRKMFEA